MSRLSVLDCTLRDGGYCNEWKFGNKNAKKILSGLVDAGVDIIECGFLTNKIVYDADITKYTTVGQATSMIPTVRKNKMFVCMINYGEYQIDDIPDYHENSIDGLRIAFHKKDMIPALAFCEAVQSKGYKVFVQPMVSLSYSDEEFLNLIHRVNSFCPYAFYIVDSFGVMKRKDLVRLFYMVEHNLTEGIAIGYHSHNNMQLAYSNAQTLVDIRTKRDLIIDSCIFGMGRGAGNLNTELFVEYLNDNIGASYTLKPLLVIIDEILNPIYQQNYWGYSLPNYLSASYNTHPNYAQFLCDKSTLTLKEMNDILARMDDKKRSNYDKDYMQQIYVDYLTMNEMQSKSLDAFRTGLSDKRVLLVAPGKSAVEEADVIKEFAADKNTIVVSINFDYEQVHTDYVFISNLRRFKTLDHCIKDKCIVTSNIMDDEIYLQTDIQNLLNNHEMVRDNAGMMAIKFFINLGITEINLAGFDGYSIDNKNNYIDEKMSIINKVTVIDAINDGIRKTLKEYGNMIKVNFITKPRYLYE